MTCIAAFAAFFYAISKAFSRGRDVERALQNQEAVSAHQKRSKINDETSKLGNASVCSDLSQWVRQKPDGGE
ncbi:hypothetical protein WJT86_10160 [Microvirga sp. W0021]|uniref:Uncharacterized protein n=1 Tax=Hohaiivirga grylli TaxID=3133970 RepID=A0ABV0BKF7_9HYPH